jgi:hypothetical protein
MKLISELTIQRARGNAVIQFLQGDLSAIPADHRTDILVLSAFPGCYLPTEGTLIGSLYDKGLDVEMLSGHKQADLREQLDCWLSQPLDKSLQKKLNIKRILCFEPGRQINASQELVGNIFRCINTFAFDDKNNVVAMPMVASGCQAVAEEAMLPALLDAGIFWLESGLPLVCIKFVIYREEQVAMARKIFEKVKKKYRKENGAIQMEPTSVSPKKPRQATAGLRKRAAKIVTINAIDWSVGSTEATNAGIESVPPNSPAVHLPAPAGSLTPGSQPAATDHYDYFISYAHTHSDLVHSFVKKVKEKNTNLQIFYDRESIPPGGLWIRQLSAAIQKANKVLVFLSPDYDKSPVCWDEFQCAKLMEYNRRKQIIQTIYLYDYREMEMPPIMGIYSYIDCREGDAAKLTASIDKLMNGQA